MASVNVPQKRDPLDQVMKGLQIAQSAFGIYSDYKKLGAMSQAEEDANNSVINTDTKASLVARGMTPVKEEGPDTVQFNEKTPDGYKPVFLKLPTKEVKPEKPRYSTVTTNEGVFAVNTADPNDVKRLGSRPRPEKAGSAEPKQKSLPSGDAMIISKSDTAMSTLEDLMRSWNEKASSLGSGLASILPNSTASNFKDESMQAARIIGQFLEGGGRGLTDADVRQYQQMMPGPWDTAETARNKADSLAKKIATKRQSDIDALGSAGYMTSNFGPGRQVRFSKPQEASSSGTATAAPQMQPEDIQALQWAQAHPNDRRSIEIKKRLGAK